MLKVCLLGYGGIGHVHCDAYRQLEQRGKARLTGVCDIRPDCFDKEISINISSESKEKKLDFRTYQDLDEMLCAEQPDMVDICLPTWLHREKAVYLLKSGYHVLCEKPMALTYEECCAMTEAAKESGKELMIGQCLRFFTEYEYLKGLIDDGLYGKPTAAFLQRLSPPPTWAWKNWYMDEALSGGCIQDLHVHDLDMARCLFGEPKRVSSHAKDGFGRWDCAHSTLEFEGLFATVIGDWSLQDFSFEASYRVSFEKAAVVCCAGKVTVYPAEGEVFSPEFAPKNGYAAEIEYFVDVVTGRTENVKNPAESAAESIRLVETLRKSAEQGGKKLAFRGSAEEWRNMS